MSLDAAFLVRHGAFVLDASLPADAGIPRMYWSRYEPVKRMLNRPSS